MSDYVCPKEIQDEYERNPAAGLARSIEWVKTLELQPGDRVWMPEGGWFEKGEGMQH